MWRNRKLRLGIVLAIAVFAAFYAWRMEQGDAKKPPCESGRHEEKDAGGKVVKVTRTSCF
jgi:hypothetical protein